MHSFVKGHLDYFRILAIVNSAAMNILVACVFFKESFVWMYAQEWNCWVIDRVVLYLVF